MTALDKYQRLEAEAVYRANEASQAQNVILSLGDATLTIATFSGAPISHWSLPALKRLNPGKRPAIYVPGPDSEERLEIADTDMIAAIEKLLGIVSGKIPNSAMRRLIYLAAIVIPILLAWLWLPTALAQYTAKIAPSAARAEMGLATLRQVERLTGPACQSPLGSIALERLAIRLFPKQNYRIAVFPSAFSTTAHLPGGWLLVSHKLVEDFENPEVLAGHLLAETLRMSQEDPVVPVMKHVGWTGAIGFITQGHLSENAARLAAEGTIATPPKPVNNAALIEAMRHSQTPSAPYGLAIDLSGETTNDFLTANTAAPNAPPVLSDGDWISLQQICE